MFFVVYKQSKFKELKTIIFKGFDIMFNMTYLFFIVNFSNIFDSIINMSDSKYFVKELGHSPKIRRQSKVFKNFVYSRKTDKKVKVFDFKKIYDQIQRQNKIKVFDNIVRNINQYSIVKVNDEFKSLFCPFLFYKDSHKLKYSKWFVFVGFVKINPTFKVPMYSIVLHDKIQTFVFIRHSLQLEYKLMFYNVLQLDSQTLENNDLILTNRDKKILDDLKSQTKIYGSYFIDLDDQIKYYNDQILKYSDLLDDKVGQIDRLKRHIEFTDKRIENLDGRVYDECQNNNHSINQMLMSLKVDELDKQQTKDKQRLNKHIQTYNYYLDKIDDYKDRINKVSIQSDDFKYSISDDKDSYTDYCIYQTDLL